VDKDSVIISPHTCNESEELFVVEIEVDFECRKYFDFCSHSRLKP